jgi:poly(A) polymerase
MPAPDAHARPVLIPRADHPISRRNISPAALKVLYGLHAAGYQSFLVGGAVRDLLAGRQPKDFDVATDATPEQVHQVFRNCRLIGRRFRLAHVVFGREIIEVATFRANDDDGSGGRQTEDGGRLLRDNVYGTIEEDAVRRDFTANALYYAIADFSVRDDVGGYEDILGRRLRLIGDPEQRYREDPVRLLRAVRLAAKLDFEIEPATAAPMPGLSSLLAGAAPARLFDETLKLFLAGHAEASFLGLERHGLLEALLPETAEALRSNRRGALRSMVLAGLRNTDRRMAEDKPVTPAFLYAVLLWPAYCRELARLQAQGLEAAPAQQRAADRVTLHQAHRIALPRRFSLPMQEIWLLQPRLALRQKKRVLRLLAHPRFRAAFDFLELRATVAPELAGDVQFWRELQAQAPVPVSPVSDDEPVRDEDALAGDEAEPSAGRSRRRRRRRPGRGGPVT